MKICEGQRLGALVVLIASVFIYTLTQLNERHPHSTPHLIWGDQESKSIAIEVTGSWGRDGIYFFPEAAVSTELSKITGSEMRMNAGLTSTLVSSGQAISVSIVNRELNAVEMSATKKLALGLPIDLNRATEEELCLVPGIGERIAAQIAQLRQMRGKFGEIADLTAISGIKGKKIRELEKYLIVGSIP